MSKREWAAVACEALLRGETIQVQPRGYSMSGRISDGDIVTLQPCFAETLVPGDMVLAQVQGRHYSHIVLHQVLEREAGRFLIGNNLGGVDGWVTVQDVFGWVVAIEPEGTMP